MFFLLVQMIKTEDVEGRVYMKNIIGDKVD